MAEANQKHMDPKYNPDKESKFVQYLDAKNLYVWAMSKRHPIDDFKWMIESEIENWGEFSEQEGEGCIHEVDLAYPRELLNFHKEYPLAPERLEGNKVEKVIPNLRDKKQYVIHHKNLKLSLSLGMKFENVHRGISFHEEAWMKPYIALNTQLRTNSKS